MGFVSVESVCTYVFVCVDQIVPESPRDTKCFLTKPGNRDPRDRWPVTGRRWIDREAAEEKKGEKGKTWREERRAR